MLLPRNLIDCPQSIIIYNLTSSLRTRGIAELSDTPRTNHIRAVMSLVKSGREAIRYFNNRKMLQTPNPAIELIKKQPTIVVKDRITHCDGGNLRLGHPRVYMNLDHGVRTCGYCGQTYKQDSAGHHDH